MNIRFGLILLFINFYITLSGQYYTGEWTELEQGLYKKEFLAQFPSFLGDNKLTIIKIDPSFFDFEMYNAETIDSKKRTIDNWVNSAGLVGAVNAGMFITEGKQLTCSGLMINKDYVNNNTLNQRYEMVLCFNPVHQYLQKVRLVDLTCSDEQYFMWQNNFQTVSQCLKVISCGQYVNWRGKNGYWSQVLWAQDKDGKTLWIFARSPFKTTDLAKQLLDSDLNIDKMMYLEGGPEASLYVNSRGNVTAKMGSYETDFNENDNNNQFWGLPNIIGIRRIHDDKNVYFYNNIDGKKNAITPINPKK
jgi:hypothetical protein